MRRILLFILALSFTLSPFAQHKTTRKKATVTAHKKVVRKTPHKKVVRRKPVARKTTPAAPSQAERKAATYSNASIRGLQGQRANIQKKIREQEQALRRNKEDVKKRLQDLMAINGEIDQRQKNIEGIQKDIQHIDGNIGILNAQLKTLEQQLQDRKNKYIRSMRYMSRHHSVQEKLMFIFSAKSLSQMYRRLSFIRQYSAFQKAQGEAVKAKQNQVNDKHRQLQTVKGHKNNLLYKGKQEKTVLEGKQQEQKVVVQGLQKQQKTILAVIADQRQKDAAINAQIDRLIAQEVAKARARAAAEAKRKAAAAAKKRAAELARKKAAAEAAARENARRIAEAKAREAAAEAARRKAAEEARLAQEAAKKAQEEAVRQAEAKAKEKAQAAARAAAEAAARQAAAEQAAREAEANRKAAELKAKADAERSKKEIAEAKQDAQEAATLSTVDRMLSGGFESNRGRLPMPISGSYRIVSHFGQYNVEGLKGVTLDNKGINILGKPGCVARSIYDGEVSAVFGYGGMWNVLVRHGAYISVYCNLKSVSVHKGQRVSARQALGAVGADHILQFQLRKETAKLNPEAWLGR